MWIIRKFPEAWAIYDEDTGFARMLDEDEVFLIAEEHRQLLDEAVKMILVPEIESISTGLPSNE